MICTSHQIFSGDKIGENEMGGACGVRMEKRRGVYRVLVGKLEVKSLLGRARPRWESTIKMDFPELG